MALRRTVRVALSDRCDGVYATKAGHRILEGTVTSVSPTDAYLIICGRHVPLGEVLSVKRPHHTDDEPSDPTDPQDRERAERMAP